MGAGVPADPLCPCPQARTLPPVQEGGPVPPAGLDKLVLTGTRLGLQCTFWEDRTQPETEGTPRPGTVPLKHTRAGLGVPFPPFLGQPVLELLVLGVVGPSQQTGLQTPSKAAVEAALLGQCPWAASGTPSAMLPATLLQSLGCLYLLDPPQSHHPGSPSHILLMAFKRPMTGTSWFVTTVSLTLAFLMQVSHVPTFVLNL